MKIESQAYTPYFANRIDSQLPNTNGSQASPAKTDEAKQTFKDSLVSQNVKNTENVAKTETKQYSRTEMPNSLNEVLTPEEKAMLQQFFPSDGSKWGVSAYKSADMNVSKSGLVGKKIDLVS